MDEGNAIEPGANLADLLVMNIAPDPEEAGPGRGEDRLAYFQLSLSVVMRLNTGLPGWLSTRSATK